MNDDFELNNKINLNPDLNAIRDAVIGRPLVPNPEVQRERAIKEWNERPEVRGNNVKAIDTNKEKPITNGKFKFMWFLAAIGVIALIGIATALGVFAKLAWDDGTLLSNPAQVICGNTTVQGSNLKCEAQACNPTLNCPSTSGLEDKINSLKNKLGSMNCSV